MWLLFPNKFSLEPLTWVCPAGAGVGKAGRGQGTASVPKGPLHLDTQASAELCRALAASGGPHREPPEQSAVCRPLPPSGCPPVPAFPAVTGPGPWEKHSQPESSRDAHNSETSGSSVHRWGPLSERSQTGTPSSGTPTPRALPSMRPPSPPRCVTMSPELETRT